MAINEGGEEMNKIEFNTYIKAPIQQCFDLARSIDFHKISVIKEESVSGCTSGLFGPNQHALLKSELWGLKLSSEIKIIKFSPPSFMSYEVSDSYFLTIEHDYYFYDISEETVMINHFYYRTRWGLIGELLNFLFLKKILSNTITKRNDLLREYAETEKSKDILPIQQRELSIVC